MHEDLWSRLLEDLAGRLPPHVLDTWIRPGEILACRDNRLDLGFPNKFSRDYVAEHYRSDLQTAAAACLGPRIHVSLGLAPAHAAPPPPAPPAATAPATLDTRYTR